MASLLLSLANNLAEGIHRIKYKYGEDNKKCEHKELNTKIASGFLNIQTLKII